MTAKQIIIIYLIAINSITFFLYGIDKWKAKRSKWRIPEATLLGLAIIGGSLGAWIGMRMWHHKTMHKKFKYGLPLILIVQISLVLLTSCKSSDTLQIKNRNITLRQDLTRGGAICFIGRGGQGRNYINVHDEGRYVQQSYYAGQSVNRQAEGQSDFWSPWPWNPIQVGDYKRNRARILEKWQRGKRTYVRCVPMLWDMDNCPAEAEMEQWTELKDNVVYVRCRLTCHRTDTVYGDVPENQQEIPAVYPISSLNHLYAYRGEHPFTSEPVDTIVVEELRFGQDGHGWGNYDDISEQWMAFMGDDGWGMGVYSPSATQFLAGRFQSSRSGEADGDATSYIAPIRKQYMPKLCTVEYEYYLLFGTIDEIRSAVYELKRFFGLFCNSINSHSRNRVTADETF